MNKTMKLLLCLVGVLALLQVTLTKGHTEEAAAPEAIAAEAEAGAEAAAEATDAAEAAEAGAEAIEVAAEDAAEDAAIELAGTISSIEAETSTIIIEYVAEDATSTSPFKVTEETAITSEDMPLALSDLKAGDQVNAIFSLDAEGTRVLTALLVQK